MLPLDALLVKHDSLKRKFDDLSTCLFKFTKGKDNLDKLLGAQNMPFKKNSLGHTCNHKNTCYTCYFVKTISSSMPNVCCTYYGKYGHMLNIYYMNKKIERGVKTLYMVKGTIAKQNRPKLGTISHYFFIGVYMFKRNDKRN